MQNKLLTIFFFNCLISFSLLSQNTNFDKLQSQLQRPNLTDSVRVITYLALANHLKHKRYLGSTGYNQKALRLSKFINNQGLLAKSRLSLGNQLIHEGDYYAGFNAVTKAYDYFHQKSDTLNLINCLKGLGHYYYSTNNKANALSNWIKGLSLAEITKNLNAQVFFHINIGCIYYENKDYSKSIRSFTTGLPLTKNVSEKKIKYLLNIALSHQELGEYEKAERYYNKALAMLKRTGDTSLMGWLQVHFSNLLLLQGRDQKALEVNILASKEFEKMNSNIHGLAFVYDNFGKIYYQLHEFEKSRKHYTLAFLKAQETKKYDSTTDIYNGVSDLQVKIQNLDPELVNFKQNKIYMDKLAESSPITKISKSLLEKYQTLKSHNKTGKTGIRKIESSIHSKNMIVIGSFIFVLAGFILRLLYKAYFRVKQANYSLSFQKEEIEKKNKQLQELNSLKDKLFSIAAHDVRGPLSSIHEFLIMFEKGEVETSEIKRHFSKINDRLKDSLEILENYILWIRSQIQEINPEPTRIKIEELISELIEKLKPTAQSKMISVSNKMNTTTYIFADPFMLKTIFRNILSNAIKYSFEGNQISIKSTEGKNTIEISVIDNGVGMNSNQLNSLFTINGSSKVGTQGEKGMGLGLILSMDLLESNNGHLKVKSSEGNGSTFTVILPKT